MRERERRRERERGRERERERDEHVDWLQVGSGGGGGGHLCSRAVAMRRRTEDPLLLSAMRRTVYRASVVKSSSNCKGMGGMGARGGCYHPCCYPLAVVGDE